MPQIIDFPKQKDDSEERLMKYRANLQARLEKKELPSLEEMDFPENAFCRVTRDPLKILFYKHGAYKQINKKAIEQRQRLFDAMTKGLKKEQIITRSVPLEDHPDIRNELEMYKLKDFAEQIIPEPYQGGDRFGSLDTNNSYSLTT